VLINNAVLADANDVDGVAVQWIQVRRLQSPRIRRMSYPCRQARPGEGSLLGSRVARSRGMSVSIAHTIDSPPLLLRSADAPPVNVVDADAAAASYTTCCCCCCCCAYRKGSRAKLRDSRLEALSRRELPAAATGVRRIHASFCASTTTTRLVAASSF